ncbi:hypothetical protein DFJ77DRAFT_17357 [Powellomyces hirtus]|nr:hypothetical protein DFJ77DRAFT_17357 [Powellomyces hirtus]
MDVPRAVLALLLSRPSNAFLLLFLRTTPLWQPLLLLASLWTLKKTTKAAGAQVSPPKVPASAHAIAVAARRWWWSPTTGPVLAGVAAGISMVTSLQMLFALIRRVRLGSQSDPSAKTTSNSNVSTPAQAAQASLSSSPSQVNFQSLSPPTTSLTLAAGQQPSHATLPSEAYAQAENAQALRLAALYEMEKREWEIEKINLIRAAERMYWRGRKDGLEGLLVGDGGGNNGNVQSYDKDAIS